MDNTDRYGLNSYIKDIAIELPSYKFKHHPFSSEWKENFEFIGREETTQQFIDLILNGDSTGAYLVAGYRGMGKTSFVNNVLAKAEKKLKDKKGEQLKPIYISFGKTNLAYNDLLKQITAALLQSIRHPFHKLLLFLIRPSNILVLSAVLFLGMLTKWLPFPAAYEAFLPNPSEKTLATEILIPAAISLTTGFLLVKVLSILIHVSPTIRIYKQLTRLYLRSGAEIAEEENVQSMIKNVNIGFFSRSTTKFPPLNSKEIEHELMSIINRIDRSPHKWWRKKMWSFLNMILAKFRYYRINRHVFIFDEMDKIDVTATSEESYHTEHRQESSERSSSTYIDEQRERKQIMIRIVSSMKNLISGTRAKFIFITGREMFEASLADIADRQFSIGSIFHKIIYIDSFLKDKQGSDPAGLSNLIENHLKYIFLPADFIKYWKRKNAGKRIDQFSFLLMYNDLLKDDRFVHKNELTEEKRTKIIIALQQFIIYLTYRTNGSPKKLTRIVEDFIINNTILEKNRPSPELRLSVRLKKKERQTKKLTFYLSYNNQFRFGFITYLYRPFLLNYRRRLKNYSDYLLVSTTYLLDHILKFHPVAFSTKNLELLPEVLSANKSPQLRNFIDDILTFLSYSYIRDTEIRLFEYKFHNKISNEILHLTNLFEEESAAFNFTLDESQPIKSHIRNKILELRQIYKDFKGSYEYINSISALNNLLGDLRFFDQEYNDAITAYSDALQTLHSINNPSLAKVEIVLHTIQLQLKIGLTYEKIKNYENALAYYTDAMNFSQTKLSSYFVLLKEETNINDIATYNNTDHGVPNVNRYSLSTTHINILNIQKTETKHQQDPETDKKQEQIHLISMNEILQTALQAYIANLYLIEKTSSQGVTLRSLANTLTLINNLSDKINNDDNETEFLYFMTYSHLAVLYFYKNTSLHSVSDESNESPDEHNVLKKIMIKPVSPDQIACSDYRFPDIAHSLTIHSLKYLIQHYYKSCGKTDGFKFVPKATLEEIQEKSILQALNIILAEDIRKHSNRNLLYNLGLTLCRLADILLTSITRISQKEGEKQVKIAFEDVISDSLFKYFREYRSSETTRELFIQNLKKEIITTVSEGLTADPLRRLRLVLGCLLTSAKYFEASGKIAYSNSQLKKILRILASVTKISAAEGEKEEKTNNTLLFLDQNILYNILRNTSINSNSTDRSQILRYKYYLDIRNLRLKPEQAKAIYNNLSTNPEMREAIILFARLRQGSVKFSDTYNSNFTQMIPEQSIVSPYNTIAFQWTRIQELNFQADLNFKLQREYFEPQLNRIFGFPKEPSPSHSNLSQFWKDVLFDIYSGIPEEYLTDLITFSCTDENGRLNDIFEKIEADNAYHPVDPDRILVTFLRDLVSALNNDENIALFRQFGSVVINSIHSLHHAIEILQTYGLNYPAGFAYTGDLYKKLGKWMQLFHLCKLFQTIQPGCFNYRLEKHLESLIGIEQLRMLDPIAIFQTAILNYRRAIELHQEGAAYKTKIQALNYLDDDFNDNIDHFASALERQLMNSGEIRRNIKKLEKMLKKSQVFDYRFYVNNFKSSS